MKTLTPKLLLCLFFAVATNASAADNPLTAHNLHMYGGLKSIVLLSAEKMPEENYAYKPTDAVRNYGAVLGHIADSQYLFCAASLGEKNPALQIEKTKTTKAELIAALKDAFAYCDKAYAITDADAATIVKFHGGDLPRLGVLNTNLVHTAEHYGNLVTYLRLKNLVPPTSDPEVMKKLTAK